jgi:hypothetical protein
VRVGPTTAHKEFGLTRGDIKQLAFIEVGGFGRDLGPELRAWAGATS